MVKFSTRFSLLLSVFVLLAITASDGQSLISDYYSVDDGLTNRLVTDLLLDQQGYVWIATENGLDRYDGYEFYHFSRTSSARDYGRLSQNKITDLALAVDGDIMIFYDGLYSSFDLLDPITLTIEKVEVSLQLSEGEARAFHVDPEGVLYAFSKGQKATSIYKYKAATRKFEQIITVAESWRMGYPKVDFLALESNNFLIHDEEHGLRLLNDGNLQSLQQQVLALDTLSKREVGSAHFLHRTKQGEVFISLSQVSGLLYFMPDSNRVKRLEDIPTYPEYSGIYEDKQGNILFNISGSIAGRYPTNDGWVCLQADGTITMFEHLKEVGAVVTAVASHDFFQDILFGLDTGLKEVRNSANKVERILYQTLEPDERGHAIQAIATTDSSHCIYLANELKYWYCYDKYTGSMDTILLRDKDGSHLLFDNCKGLLATDKGDLWGFTSNGTDKGLGMVHRYNVNSCETTTYTIPDFIEASSQFQNGKIWLGTHRDGQDSYLMSFDTLTKTFTSFTSSEGKNPFVVSHINCILVSRHWPDVLWVGTEQGLYSVNTNTAAFQYFDSKQQGDGAKGTKDGLQDNTIFTLYEDEQHKLWIGTKNGLHYYDPTSEEWDLYTTSDGLTSNTVACVLPEAHSNGLWVSTYNGLSYLVPDELDQLRRFSSIDGFAHNEFNRLSGLLDEYGRVYFGGVNGVSAFYPNDLLVQAEVPKPLLASFSYYDGAKDTLITRIADLDDGVVLTIEPYYDYFNFNFCLPVYTPNTENEFRYRIGNDSRQEWIYLNDSRSLSYSNMKKGNYTFYVQGADPNGNWSDETLLIYVQVRESFWQSPAFGFIVVTILGLIAFWFYTDRVNQKLQIERLRTQLASDLHDEVSGLLAGISLQSEILRDQTEDEILGGKLKRIWEASQGAMSKMSDVIWSIDARRDRFADLITRMEEHADEMLLPLGMRYEIQTYNLDLQQLMPATIRQNLYFIFKEAINNVAKHAKATHVDIAIGHEDKNFELLVKDNGTEAHLSEAETSGRRRKRKGQGMSNLRLRAQRLNAELKILRGRGYTIHLRMKRFL